MARKHQETVPEGWTVQAVSEMELRITPTAPWYWQNARVALILAIYFDSYPLLEVANWQHSGTAIAPLLPLFIPGAVLTGFCLWKLLRRFEWTCSKNRLTIRCSFLGLHWKRTYVSLSLRCTHTAGEGGLRGSPDLFRFITAELNMVGPSCPPGTKPRRLRLVRIKRCELVRVADLQAVRGPVGWIRRWQVALERRSASGDALAEVVRIAHLISAYTGWRLHITEASPY